MPALTPRSFFREQLLLQLLQKLGPAVKLPNTALLQLLNEGIGGWGAERHGIRERQLRRYLRHLRDTGRISVDLRPLGQNKGSCRTIRVLGQQRLREAA